MKNLPRILKENQFNKFYNNLFDTVVEGSLVLNMPDFRGSFEIDYRSNILKMICKDKYYEPHIANLIKQYVNPAKDAIDVGANIGFFTILLSKIISNKNKVLSAEPTPLALTYLRRNIERNKSSNSIIIYEGILSDKPGSYKINVIPGMEEYSSLGKLTHPHIADKNYKQIDVKGDTLDNLVNIYNLDPGFIKIDTEGAEYLVLSGALETIQKYKPVIICEVQDRLLSSFRHNSEKVFNLLMDNGYKIVNARNHELPVTMPFNDDILAFRDGE